MFKTFMCTQCVHIEGCAHVRPAQRGMTHPWPLLCNSTKGLLFTLPPRRDTRTPCWHCCRRARLSTQKTRYGEPYVRWCRARSLSCCLSPLWLFFQGSSGRVGFRDVWRWIYLYMYAWWYICVHTCMCMYAYIYMCTNVYPYIQTTVTHDRVTHVTVCFWTFSLWFFFSPTVSFFFYPSHVCVYIYTCQYTYMNTCVHTLLYILQMYVNKCT
jgi:hypothetical protein